MLTIARLPVAIATEFNKLAARVRLHVVHEGLRPHIIDFFIVFFKNGIYKI